MTDDSRSGDREDSGANDHSGNRSGEPDGRGHGDEPRPRSGYGGSRDNRSQEGRRDFRGGDRRGGRQGDRRDDRGGNRGGYRGGDRDRRDDRGGDRRGGRDFRGDDRRGGGRGDDRRGGYQGKRDGQRGGYRGRDDRRGGGRDFERNDRRDDRRPPREDRDPADIAPPLPDEASYNQLDKDTKRDLHSLPKSLAELVGKHIVAAGMLVDEDPERAYKHAVYARRKASRLPSVREASGIAAYTVGKWQEALSDLRAARRMSGRDTFLAVMADCERGLGRPERALEVANDPAGKNLDADERIELRIVAAGARRDMGDIKAALAELQVPELKERRARPYVARLFYAYADVLEEIGRTEDAREYFARASSVDRDGVTDADERLAAIEGVELVDIDVEDGIVWTDVEADADEAAAEAAPDPRDRSGGRERSDDRPPRDERGRGGRDEHRGGREGRD
ncbi:hypothetical protein GCM10027590_37690 [Nocardiopsis nanhaiensis]